MHKIEDIPPKIHAKLNKTNSTINGVSYQPSVAPRTKSLISSSATTYPTFVDRTNVSTIIINHDDDDDEDDDDDVKLDNDRTLSLEDEIFEELEKVAHDEAKLNDVLKNFDKILFDFNVNKDRSISEAESVTPVIQKGKKDQRSITRINVNVPPMMMKTLQKSKTCSIIESRCILKKNIQSKESRESSSFTIEAKQTTKSLWNLQDLEGFSRGNVEKMDFKKIVEQKKVAQPIIVKPVSSSNSTTLKKTVVKPTITRKLSDNNIKSQLPRAKSVWELSNAHSTVNLHSPCTRTISGSKIPIKLTPIKTPIRSQSFINNSTTVISTATAVTASGTTTPVKSFNNRNGTYGSSGIVEQNRKRIQSSSISSIALNKIGNNNNNKTLSIKQATSELHLNKLSNQNQRIIPLNRRINGNGPMKNYSASTINLNNTTHLSKTSPTTTTAATTTTSSGALLNKTKRDFVVRNKTKDDISLGGRKVSPSQSSLSNKINRKQHDYGIVIVNKKTSSSTANKTASPLVAASSKSSSSTTSAMEKRRSVGSAGPVIVKYANEKSLVHPNLESCKIIPPILGGPPKHAELLVPIKNKIVPPTNTNTFQQRIKIHQDSMLCINSDIVRSEKEYQSDCSDDSGHISNENDDLMTTDGGTVSVSSSSSDVTDDCGDISSGGQKTGKISETLLEKFEQIKIKENNNNNKRSTIVKIKKVNELNNLNKFKINEKLVIQPTKNQVSLFN